MGRRKFYYGDLAVANNLSETSHTNHTVKVLGTVIRTYNGKRHSAVYKTLCECGSSLMLGARKLSYTDRDDFPLSLEESRKRAFLRELGVHDSKDEMQMDSKIDSLLSAIPDSWSDIIRRRSGLTPDGIKETCKAIAYSHGISGERVRQLQAKGMRRIHAQVNNSRKEVRRPGSLMVLGDEVVMQTDYSVFDLR